MTKIFTLFLTAFFVFFICACHGNKLASAKSQDTILVSDTIQYHPVRINKVDGSILPWYSSDLGNSYDTVLLLVWNFWKNLPADSTGDKYYLHHQVYQPGDRRGLGGDQLMMALSSWDLLYDYTGDESIIENMKYIANYYIKNSLSSPECKWANLPYPYNTVLYSGKYDGDMVIGKGYLQPDKAGSLGCELIKLYKKTREEKYLEVAEKIANTMAGNIQAGDINNSPWPFKVNAKTGEPGELRPFDFNYTGKPENGKDPQPKTQKSTYTTNWTGALTLFSELIIMNKGNPDQYKKAFDITLNWLKKYPLKTNKWGPFFEDVPGWSDTQINAITFAMYILQNRILFPDWQKDVKGIIDWTYRELGNRDYSKYKVEVMNEQTAYRVPGNSHSSRQASVELMYTILTGDTTYKTNAIRTLNWATYTVANDGRNRYIRDDIWLTDGYGDYVRHYLRAMAAMPELAPADKNRFLGSTSVVTSIKYVPDSIIYSTYDPATDVLRLKKKPVKVTSDGIELKESGGTDTEGFSWKDMSSGGMLKIKHNGKKIGVFLEI
jgi:hypothetical protein